MQSDPTTFWQKYLCKKQNDHFTYLVLKNEIKKKLHMVRVHSSVRFEDCNLLTPVLFISSFNNIAGHLDQFILIYN